MDVFLLITAIALVIALGIGLIHRLNAQHDARIAAHRFSDPFPPLRRPPGYHRHRTPGLVAGRRRGPPPARRP
ncbi:hypothetical protein [Streptomyces sp. Da 82-17]|uniref:hypothetical protein n=1 Tax=Streptomyces sp. Da 82-17 TaxID=3377116 RepID=UPI0038D44A40